MFATKKYNNIVKEKLWGQVDPKDAHILALTTTVTGLEETLISEVAYYTHVDNATGSSSGKRILAI